MAFGSSSQPFRLANLPREIRDKIYRMLLCSFGPQPSTVTPPIAAEDHPEFVNELAVLDHDIDTSILVTSKQIHREAYDTMVKTNRFVRVTSSGGYPIRLLLNHLRVPVVTDNEWSVDEFKGYVLSVSLSWLKGTGMWSAETPFSTEPCSLMMLGRDMGVFCDILMDGDTHLPGFGMKTALKLVVAPGSVLVPSSYKEPITDFFSETTQRTLLQPFRKRLRGFKKVKVRGSVDRALAQAAEEDMAQDTASDPDAVITKYQELKDRGQQFFKAQDTEEASLAWLDAALEIEQLLQGSSWPVLTQKGGVSFVARLAEIYFLMKLNIAHIKLGEMETGVPYASIMADDALRMAMVALKKDYWMPDFRWHPTNVQKAKLSFRYAVYLRLERNSRSVDVAVRSIQQAYRLLPGDAGVLRERDLIMAWKASVG